MMLGAQKTHSQGRISKDDEGDLVLAVLPDFRYRIVRLEFGTEITWLGLDKSTALALAEEIRQAATKL